MKNFCKIIFLSILFSINAEAQPVTWQKWYDYNDLEDEGQDIIQTFEGGYMILTNIYSTRTKSVVIKTDKFGNVEWEKLYDMNNVGGYSLLSRSITQSLDSGFIISGDNRDSAIIFKINKVGILIWIKKYSKLNRIAGGFLDHKMTYNRGIISCGYLYDPSIGYVVKTDSIGNNEWDSVYEYYSDVLRILESKDGSFYMLGIENNNSKIIRNKKINDSFISIKDVNNVILTKTNNFGNIIWKRNLFLQNPIDIIELSSQYIFVGGGLDSMILYKIDTLGTTIFQKGYYRGIEGCSSMCISLEGNILLAGVKNVNNAFLMAVSKIEPTGNLIFNQLIPSLIEKDNFAFLPRAVNPTSDYGFVITGFTDYPQNFQGSNIYASKTDSQCNASLIVGISSNNLFFPVRFNLFQNYPNPFNPYTTIHYELSSPGFVSLKIIDINGKIICTLVAKYQSANGYKIVFDARFYNLASGVYFCNLSLDDKSITNKLLVIK